MDRPARWLVGGAIVAGAVLAGSLPDAAASRSGHQAVTGSETFPRTAAIRPDPDPHPCSSSPELSTHGMAASVDVAGIIAEIKEHFDEIDVAANGGDPDGRVTINDLEAASLTDESYAGGAAYLAVDERRHLFEVIETDGAGNGPVSTDGRMTRRDLDKFMEKRRDLALVWEYFDDLDRAAHPDQPSDGKVSDNDFAAAKDDGRIPERAREAFDRAEDLSIRWNRYLHRRDVVRELVARQTFVEDPEAANGFVRSLPRARNGKGSGLWQNEFEPDDVTALARSALVPAGDDLTEVQAVIARLPETDDGTRNKLITGLYCDLAKRADAIFSVGDPDVPPGATWLDYAPWASFGVGKVIAAELRAVFGFDPPPTARQAAGDGNQWIFNDITSKFAAFIEMYESADGSPSSAALQKFFTKEFEGGGKRFGDGALEIRSAFVLYAASLRQSDPATRQRLMFQANALVAIHEQAGVDGFLDDVMVGPLGVEVPDWKASQYMDLTMGAYVLEVNEDLDDNGLGVHRSALIDDNDVLDLDPGVLSMNDVEEEIGVDLPDISGWGDAKSDRDPKVVVTEVADWQSRKGKVPSGSTVDDSLEATGVGSWRDYGDRMWFLFRMFEQLHTDPSVPPASIATVGPSAAMRRVWRSDDPAVCSGMPDRLPDGVYFGFLDPPTPGGSTISFDLACTYNSAQWEALHPEVDPTEINEDNVVNESPKRRTLPASMAVEYWKLNDTAFGSDDSNCGPGEVVSNGENGDGWCRAAPGFVATDHSDLWDGSSVWIRVDGGVVVEIVEKYVS